MKHDKRTIEEIGGFVTIHVALPPENLKWAVKTAKHEGHKDVSLVIRRALEHLADKSSTPLLFLSGF